MHNDYKVKYKDPQDRSFVEYMIYGTYASMDIEDEAVLDYNSLYKRYEIYIDGMISRGIHKDLLLKSNYGPQN